MDKRVCIICGREYIPTGTKQKTCSEECRLVNRRRYSKEYQRDKRRSDEFNEYKRMKMREYRARERMEEQSARSPAEGYAERQRQKTLEMVGKVQI